VENKSQRSRRQRRTAFWSFKYASVTHVDNSNLAPSAGVTSETCKSFEPANLEEVMGVGGKWKQHLDLEMAVGVDIVSLAQSRAQRKSCRRRHLTGSAPEDWIDPGSTRELRSDCGINSGVSGVANTFALPFREWGNERVVRALGDVVQALRTTREVAA
jgi:hypothetical protein